MASTRWTWITSLAVLFAGVTNAHAHVHYCFDGQEPPAALHVGDSPEHSHEHANHASQRADTPDHGAEADHDDLDVDLLNKALAKVVKHDQLGLAPLPAWSTVVDARPAPALAWSVDTPPAPDPLYARPPLRGPPR
jgi:hypothetical protein